MEGVVLEFVLMLHPDHLTIPALVREITAGSIEIADEGDTIERAIRNLTSVGLLKCPGGIVMPANAT